MKRTFVCLAALLFTARLAHAHGMRSVHLELTETARDRILGVLQTTYPDPHLQARFPAACTREDSPGQSTDHVRSFALHCPGGLSAGVVALDGLGLIHTEAVVRLVRLDGRVVSRIVTPEQPAFEIPVGRSQLETALDYTQLGVRHIFTGFDHLLFLLALALVAGSWRRVMLAETAFTLSHSISFSLTALDIVRVYAPAAEACIALSLVVMACEGEPDPAERFRPALLALVFGLVHGLGFAGGLREMGLPDRAVAGALVGFGLGVELGQVAFLSVIVAGIALVRHAGANRLRVLRLGSTYLVGVTGTYWLFERLAICFGA